MLRIALIGCGRHGRSQHAAPMGEYARWHGDEVSLVAACDLETGRARAACELFGFGEAYGDWEEMLRKARPDAVVCAAPVEAVAELGEAMLRAGVPCTIEKPIGRSPEEARRLADVAAKANVPHRGSVNRRFNPALVRAAEWARQRGPIRMLRAAMVRSGRREPAFLWGTAIHVVDAMIHLAGPVRSVAHERFTHPEMSSAWAGAAFEFESGCRGQLAVAPTAGAVEESYELFGEDYWIRAVVLGPDAPSASLRCRVGDELVREDFRFDTDLADYHKEGSYAEFAHFVACLRAGRPLGPTVGDVLPGMEICFRLAGAT